MLTAQKRLEYQARSKEWAESLDGKRVIVFFNINQHLCFANSSSSHNALGVAKRIEHDFKWGRLRVYLDSEEYYRIVETRGDWEPGKVLHMSVHAPWGLEVKLDREGRWYTDVTWGCRESVRNWEAFSKEFVMKQFMEVRRNGASSIEASRGI